MTVSELLTAVDALHPNQFPKNTKLRWLNEVEQTLYEEVILTHEQDLVIEKPEYNSESDNDVLLAEDPYSRLYVLWLDAQISYYNHESMQYDRAAQSFNDAYQEWRNWYNRNHMPVGRVNHLHLIDRRWDIHAATGF